MNTITNSLRKALFLALASLTGMLSVNSASWAASCAFDPADAESYGARYVLRVDAGTTCAEMGMEGCDPVVGGSGSCT